MLNPIFGISTLFHIATIIWNKLFELLPGTRRIRATRANMLGAPALFVIGCFIITGMFAFVLTGAGVLLYSSAHDSHATFRYLPELMKESTSFVLSTSSILTPAWHNPIVINTIK